MDKFDPEMFTERELTRFKNLWDQLGGGARDTLHCLVKHGPTYDGNVPSKVGRDELVGHGLAAKIVLKNGETGYQAATYLGYYVLGYGMYRRRAA